MTFDLDQTLSDMLDAISGVVASDWPKVNSCVNKALQDEKDALEAIANARLNGEIDDEEVKSQLADEKEALKAALLVCKIKTKAMAQKAANAAIKVLTDAIKVALKIA
jgi:hypothetical protein